MQVSVSYSEWSHCGRRCGPSVHFLGACQWLFDDLGFYLDDNLIAANPQQKPGTLFLPISSAKNASIRCRPALENPCWLDATEVLALRFASPDESAADATPDRAAQASPIDKTQGLTWLKASCILL